jgi:hypothetical protein
MQTSILNSHVRLYERSPYHDGIITSQNDPDVFWNHLYEGKARPPGNGTLLGGNIPDGYDLETALRDTPVIMRSVQAFNRGLRSHETSAFTLLGDPPVTLFGEGKVSSIPNRWIKRLH